MTLSANERCPHDLPLVHCVRCLRNHVETLRSDLTACQLEKDLMRAEVTRIAGNMPMSAMTRTQLLAAVRGAKPQECNERPESP